MDKAIVLLSGGMNGAVAAAAVHEQYDIYPLFVFYHQRAASREARAFESLCEHFEVERRWTAELSHFRQVGGNALVDAKRKIDDALDITGGTTSAFVPGLIPTLLSTAAAFAQRIGARAVITGVNEAIDQPQPGRAVLYPDQRREFLYSFQYMLEAAMPESAALRVEAPVIDFQRREIIKLGLRLQVPLQLTWSCYDGREEPCGACYGCASRAIGFAQAREPDPLLLESAS